MIATPIPEPIPIYKDEHGRLRITNTRVLLDLVIHAFHLGHTPETITEQYPSRWMMCIWQSATICANRKPRLKPHNGLMRLVIPPNSHARFC
jgi:hypothetical protein